ncbi:MAG: transcription initiation factor IIB family protein [Haloarculaceae archaeon]
MYRASDEVAEEEWLAELEEVADRLGLGSAARSRAADLFLSTVPESDRSKRATLATSLYVGALTERDRRSQREVADAAGVARLTVQKRWKEMMEQAGLDPPDW